MTKNIWLYAIITFILVLIFMPISCELAKKFGFTDKPGGRKRHVSAVPPIGGIVIFSIFIFIVSISGKDASLWYFVALIIVLTIGVLDERLTILPWIRLCVQFIAAIVLVVYGKLRIDELGNLFGSGLLHTGWMEIPFTIFCIVLLINAINLVDGLDGLAGGLGFIITFWLALCGYIAHNVASIMVTIILGAAIAGFLFYNLRHKYRKSASVFLGNSGSLALGLSLSWLSINLSQGDGAVIRPISVAWLLGIPIYDICGQFARRISLGRHPFNPDRHHFHHHFLYAGLSDAQATTIILAISFAMGLIGIGGIWLGLPEYCLTYAWMFLLLTHIYLSMRPLRYLKLLLPLRGKSIDNIIGKLILESGVVNSSQLIEAIDYQAKFGGKVGEILIDKGYITEPELDFFLNLQIIRNTNDYVLDVNRKKEFLLGEIMVATKSITKDQLQKALTYQIKYGGWIGQVLLNMGFISEKDLKECISVQNSIKMRREFLADNTKL